MIYENNKPVRMDITDALKSLYPTKKWRYNEDTGVVWISTDTPQPSQAELDTEVQRLQTEWESQEYQRKRKMEYPTIEELVVALYDTEDKAVVETKRAVIKAKYPKGG
jgi:hypothetical protein|tara:strand:- start:47 stop:370 length:324 start_codon:yes stop_codon:yes gene_type:complete